MSGTEISAESLSRGYSLAAGALLASVVDNPMAEGCSGERDVVEAEDGEDRRMNGDGEGVSDSVSVDDLRGKVELTSQMKQRVSAARDAQEAEEKAKAEKKAERKAQKEKKLLLEMEQSTVTAEGSVPPTAWNCPICTFENGIAVRKCGVCGTYRPAEAVPKAKETPKSVASSSAGAASPPAKKGASTSGKKKSTSKRKVGDIEVTEEEEEEEDNDQYDDEEDMLDEDGEPARKSKKGADGRKRRIFPNDKRLKANREGKPGEAERQVAAPASKRSNRGSESAGSKHGHGKRRGQASAISNGGASTPQSALEPTHRARGRIPRLGGVQC